MKKNIVFQFIIILLILIFWNLIHLGYNFQKQNYFTEISEIPIILFSEEPGTLDSLKIQINQLNYIARIFIQNKTEIMEDLISKYDLDSVKTVLEDHSLPNVMNIFPDGKNFNRVHKDELMNIITAPDLSFEYDHGLWESIHTKIDLLDKSYRFLNILMIIFFLFLTVFLRIHFEFKHDHFWKIYRASGGKFYQRRKYFMINSLILIFVPVLLIYFSYLLLLNNAVLSIEIEPVYFGLEIVVLVFSSIISFMILGKRLL